MGLKSTIAAFLGTSFLIGSPAAFAQGDSAPSGALLVEPGVLEAPPADLRPAPVCELRVIPAPMAASRTDGPAPLVSDLVSGGRKGKYRASLGTTLAPERQVTLIAELAHWPLPVFGGRPYAVMPFGSTEPFQFACHAEIKVERIEFVSTATWSALEVRFSYWGVREATVAPLPVARTIAVRMSLGDGTDSQTRTNLEQAFQASFSIFCRGACK